MICRLSGSWSRNMQPLLAQPARDQRPGARGNAERQQAEQRAADRGQCQQQDERAGGDPRGELQRRHRDARDVEPVLEPDSPRRLVERALGADEHATASGRPRRRRPGSGGGSTYAAMRARVETPRGRSSSHSAQPTQQRGDQRSRSRRLRTIARAAEPGERRKGAWAAGRSAGDSYSALAVPARPVTLTSTLDALVRARAGAVADQILAGEPGAEPVVDAREVPDRPGRGELASRPRREQVQRAEVVVPRGQADREDAHARGGGGIGRLLEGGHGSRGRRRRRAAPASRTRCGRRWISLIASPTASTRWVRPRSMLDAGERPVDGGRVARERLHDARRAGKGHDGDGLGRVAVAHEPARSGDRGAQRTAAHAAGDVDREHDPEAVCAGARPVAGR